jgi:hypothetical protein
MELCLDGRLPVAVVAARTSTPAKRLSYAGAGNASNNPVLRISARFEFSDPVIRTVCDIESTGGSNRNSPRLTQPGIRPRSAITTQLAFFDREVEGLATSGHRTDRAVAVDLANSLIEGICNV